MGNIELYALGDTSTTIQFPSYCLCGICLVRSPEQTDKIKNRNDIISNPLYIIKECQSRQRHGPDEWQFDHWKAKDATTNAKKRRCKTITGRWIDDPQYQETEQAHRWTLKDPKYLDNLKTVNLDYVATWHERDRYQYMLVLRYKNVKNPGWMSIQDDFQRAA